MVLVKGREVNIPGRLRIAREFNNKDLSVRFSRFTKQAYLPTEFFNQIIGNFEKAMKQELRLLNEFITDLRLRKDANPTISEFFNEHKLEKFLHDSRKTERKIDNWCGVLLEMVRAYGKAHINKQEKVTLQQIIDYSKNEEYEIAYMGLDTLFQTFLGLVTVATELWHEG